MDNKLLCTEGDWKVIKTGSFFQVVKDLGEGESPEICRLFVKTMDLGDDAEANAHLIAASKDLYTTLNDIVIAYELKMGAAAIKLRINLAKDALKKANPNYKP